MPKKIGCQRKTFACPGVSAFLVCEIWTSPTPHGCPMQNESHIHYRRNVTMITTGYQHVHISNNTSHRLRSVKPVPTTSPKKYPARRVRTIRVPVPQAFTRQTPPSKRHKAVQSFLAEEGLRFDELGEPCSKSSPKLSRSSEA